MHDLLVGGTERFVLKTRVSLLAWLGLKAFAVTAPFHRSSPNNVLALYITWAG